MEKGFGTFSFDKFSKKINDLKILLFLLKVESGEEDKQESEKIERIKFLSF